jgi:predicted lipoprotein with Yx(FWY)xxD motif
MIRLFAVAAVLSVLVLAGCGDDDSGTEPATTPATQEDGGASAQAGPNANDTPDRSGADEQTASGTEIMAADSQYGSILFDSKPQAIYLFDKETSSTSECYGACAEAWPPVLTDGEPQAGSGANAKLLGTTERDDGSIQVTYAGHPLYYYVDDPPGEVLCQNVEEFGGLWLVVEPGGEAVQ